MDTESRADLLSKSGIGHLELDGQSLLLITLTDSISAEGCGIIMPGGYAARGRRLSNAISAAASLSIYRNFSIQLLSAVTGVGLLFIIIAGFVISRIMSGQLVKPLEKLTEGARRLGHGDLDYRVELLGGDEFAGLARSFNRMASEIAENQKKLIEAERIAAWREVARRIAHEIRNPITPVTVEIYRLQNLLSKLGDKDTEEISASLETVSAQIEALKELAEHFSAFAKEPELHKQKCSIEAVIINTTKLYEGLDNVSIKMTIPPDLPQVDIDTRMMGRVFGNVIKNSVEASPESAKIDIEIAREAEIIKITIKDNGPGFPSEKLEKIDTPYITTKKSGTGLGLAIIKKIVEEHGGRLKLYNHNGAVTEIKLPVT
jgi:nitrogen fixation/metabolism regulation signal transduction histidine kinase